MESRACEDLVNLVRWTAPLDELIGTASRCDQVEGASVRLNRSAVREVLQRCVSGELDARELPRWAGAVHMLECVEIGEGDVDLLTRFLFEVSTPELFEPVTADTCRQWIGRLDTGND